jgi:hypothetical protein
LLEGYERHLRAIIHHCVHKDAAELTPSDLNAGDMDIEEFEDILASLWEK